MLLDDEEIKKAVHKGDDHGFAGEVIGYGYKMLEEVAKAQLKKVVEWLEMDCDEHLKVSASYNKEFYYAHADCPECQQSLLEEIK